MNESKKKSNRNPHFQSRYGNAFPRNVKRPSQPPVQGKEELPVIAITIGDPNGIGPELILKAFSHPILFQQCIPVIVAHREVVNYYARILKLTLPTHIWRDGQQPKRDKLNFYPPKSIATPLKPTDNKKTKPAVALNPGVPTPESGDYAFRSVQQAINLIRAEKADALVTAPISKEAIHAAGHAYPGHTELLAEAFGKSADEVLMTFVAEDLRVAMVTTHIPLIDVPKVLSPRRLEQKLLQFIASLGQDFGIDRPRIAVCGLNPHAGENGLIGREEKEWIAPLIEKMQQQGYDVLGPYPADGLWGSGLWAKFDGIMALYHDQGLIPFKFMAGGRGVNFTAGLPVIRTSPTHGTAFGIAGQGQGDPSSFLHAIWMALDLWHRRSKKNRGDSIDTSSVESMEKTV